MPALPESPALLAPPPIPPVLPPPFPPADRYFWRKSSSSLSRLGRSMAEVAWPSPSRRTEMLYSTQPSRYGSTMATVSFLNRPGSTASISSMESTLATPMLLPRCAGFRQPGRVMPASAASISARGGSRPPTGLRSTAQGSMGMPAPERACLVAALSMKMADASTRMPV